MTNAIDALHNALIIMRTDNKATIKGMVAKLEEQGFDSALWDTKTKVTFIESIDAKAKELFETTLVTELDALKIEITETINKMGENLLQLGRLLNQARDAHDSQAEFLEWVDVNFSIKKAYAFRLMKVAKVFTDEAWQGVPVIVLHNLQAQATDEQVEQARKLALAGEFNSTADLNKLLGVPDKPAVKPTKPAEQQITRAAESVQNALIESGNADVKVEIPAAHSGAQEPQQDVSELLSKIDSMAETINQLTKQLAEANKPRLSNANLMPMLPQFTSKSMYARLGLDHADNPTKADVLEAFKALCKLGYGRAHQEAFALIDEARHNLCNSAEVVEVAA